jgi:acyl carrier protein
LDNNYSAEERGFNMTDEQKMKIFDILHKEVRLDPASIDPNSDFRDQINIDSMQFVALIARLEKEFDIEVPISAMEVKTLNEFLGALDVELKKIDAFTK